MRKDSVSSVFIRLILGILGCTAASADEWPASAFVEQHKLLASDAGAFQRFGSDVAVHGNSAIVGAFSFSGQQVTSRSAYIYDVETGEEIHRLSPIAPDEGAGFGISVDIGETYAIVGTRRHESDQSRGGTAHVFDLSTGEEVSTLMPPQNAAGLFFGQSVAIQGRTAVVGAPANRREGASQGSAYLYDVPTGKLIAELVPPEMLHGRPFGQDVDIDDGIVIVGDPGSSVYAFDSETGQELQVLRPQRPLADEDWVAGLFGEQVAINNGSALIGSRFAGSADSQNGAAFLFDVTSGSQLTVLRASEAGSGSQFGGYVALGDEFALVGDAFDSDLGERAGAVYVYSSVDWSPLDKLHAADGTSWDWFSRPATDGRTILVGASGNDDFGSLTGSAYLFMVVPEPSCIAIALATISLILLPPRSQGTAT